MSIRPDDPLVEWLLSGDPSIAYRAKRDLLGVDDAKLRSRIAREGWGARYLEARRADGSWGQGFYRPKWTSTHYTLLRLAEMGFPPGEPGILRELSRIATDERGPDGGVNPSREIARSDVCINGMFLRYAIALGASEAELRTVLDFALSQEMPGGGFNCRLNRSGARHPSLHSTVSVGEGLLAWVRAGFGYRAEEARAAAARAAEVALLHRIFKSDRTGEVIDPRFLRLSYPYRWHYTALRALEWIAAARPCLSVGSDGRLSDAISWLRSKRRPDGTWPLQAGFPGEVHFKEERVGQPSREVTLAALVALSAFGI